MKIHDMHWGFDAGEMITEPGVGSCVVEVTFLDENDKRLYVCSSLMDNCEALYVTKKSVFKKIMNPDFDPDDLAERALEYIEYMIEDDEEPSEIADSAYADEIRFTRLMMETFVSLPGNPGKAEAQGALKQYVGHDAKEYDLPYVTYGCIDDEYDDDEEDE